MIDCIGNEIKKGDYIVLGMRHERVMTYYIEKTLTTCIHVSRYPSLNPVPISSVKKGDVSKRVMKLSKEQVDKIEQEQKLMHCYNTYQRSCREKGKLSVLYSTWKKKNISKVKELSFTTQIEAELELI